MVVLMGTIIKKVIFQTFPIEFEQTAPCAQ